MRLSMRTMTACALVAGLGWAVGAHAATNLVTNGGFDQTNLSSGQIAFLHSNNYSGFEDGSDGSYGQGVTGWTSSIGGGAAFNLWYFGDGSEKTKEARTQYGELGQHPNANYTGVSPNGGAFMILDGDPGYSGTLSQTIGGLTSGQTYTLQFYWSAGELADRTGYQTDRLDVSFGAQTQSTETFHNSHPYTNNPNNLPGDFEGWTLETMTFKATSASQVLSFLSVGTPAMNLPPVAFLDGVSLVAVPEPAIWTVMVLGFGAMGASMRRRRAARAAG